MMAGVSLRIRPFAAAADRAWVRQLWQAAMPPSWPVLPAGIGQLGEGLIAQAGNVRVGFAALDKAGSIRSTSWSPGPGPGQSPGPFCWRAPARTPYSRRYSVRPRGPSAASASPRRCTGRGSARPWSCAPPRSSGRPVSAPATSAGPPASRSTAARGTGPGGDMPCTPARSDPQFVATAPSRPTTMIAERNRPLRSINWIARRNRHLIARRIGRLPGCISSSRTGAYAR
jgi:hypothetical protein